MVFLARPTVAGATQSLQLNFGFGTLSERRWPADFGQLQDPFRSSLAVRASELPPHARPECHGRRDIRPGLPDEPGCWPAGPPKEGRQSELSSLRGQVRATRRRSRQAIVATSVRGKIERGSPSLDTLGQPLACLIARRGLPNDRTSRKSVNSETTSTADRRAGKARLWPPSKDSRNAANQI